jgi:two-component sensor histidine kinase
VAIGSNQTFTRTSLSEVQRAHIAELVTEWQLLADLSFADLTLWAPLRPEPSSWPEGHIAIAHIRPTTASTCYANDPIGLEIRWGSNSRIDEALATGEIIRDNKEERLNEFTIKEEAIPVNHQGQVIAVISRVRNIETMRTPSKLELNYREIANQIYRMISQGTFPIAGNVYLSESAPRVGDGLIRLALDGSISYASPNALSAFNRLGWQAELLGENLGGVIDSLPKQTGARENYQASEEGWQVALSGKLLRRAEFENDQGTIDLFAIPLLEGAPRSGSERVGAMVLVRDVTELRRRERALISKDATIREIHHRVKNNLQTVSALLRLQARRISDPAASEALDQAVRRVGSIALVHETLASNTAEFVDFDGVVDRIIHSEIDLSLRSSPSPISYQREGSFGELSAQIATPLALVLTELIHNAIEHGLADAGSTLLIRCQRGSGNTSDQISSGEGESSQLLVEVVDDGVGISEDFSIEGRANLGLEIVRTLTENELTGELTFIAGKPGTVVRIVIPDSRVNR